MLEEKDSLDREFFLEVSPDSRQIATGAYNTSGHILDVHMNFNNCIKAEFDRPRGS